MYFNARRIVNKLADLFLLVEESLSELDSISETWLRDKHLIPWFIPCLSVRSNCVLKGRGGGVSILALKHTDAILTESKFFSSGCQLICIDVVCNRKLVCFKFIDPCCPAVDTRELLDSILELRVVDRAKNHLVTAEVSVGFVFYAIKKLNDKLSLTPDGIQPYFFQHTTSATSKHNFWT